MEKNDVLVTLVNQYSISSAFTLRIKNKTGITKWLEVNTSHIPSVSAQSVTRVLGGCRDVTEWKNYVVFRWKRRF